MLPSPSSREKISAPSRVVLAAVAAACVAFTGCATTRPVAYSGLASAAQLRANHGGDSDRIPFAYSPEVDWREYSRVIIDPVGIYQGEDAQFEKVTDEDKNILVRYMADQFRDRLRTRYRVVATVSSETLRVKLTLTGAKATTKVIGTVLRFDIAGGSYNLVQSARGKEGAMTGSVSYAVEIYDAATNRLLKAYVGKQYPNAMNVAATMGALDAAKTGIQKAAADLLSRLD